jgi:hypothetical protein
MKKVEEMWLMCALGFAAGLGTVVIIYLLINLNF